MYQSTSNTYYTRQKAEIGGCQGVQPPKSDKTILKHIQLLKI